MTTDVPAASAEEPLGQLRRLGDEVRDIASDLPGHEDDVTDLLEPRPAPAPEPAPDFDDNVEGKGRRR